MTYSEQAITRRKLNIELEVTGDDEQFALLERLCEGYVNGVRSVAHVTKITQRVSCAAFLTPIQQPKKSHSNVQLPTLNGNGAAKQTTV